MLQCQDHRPQSLIHLENSQPISLLRKLILTFLGHDGQEKTRFYGRMIKGWLYNYLNNMEIFKSGVSLIFVSV